MRSACAFANAKDKTLYQSIEINEFSEDFSHRF